MRLKKIIENIEIVSIKNFKNYNIKCITHKSEDVIKSSIFICIKGNNFDGNNYIENAILKGAKCIVTDKENVSCDSVCIVVVKDVRKAMSVMAYNFYNRCVDGLKIIGIVGTSGKTTITSMISQILSANGNNIGVIGTNGIYFGNIRLENKFTTPDPLELHYIFYQMTMLGVKTVIMEISAQAIYYKKVYGILFDICVFTNISREHLDFFGSMENYAKVKMDFFSKNNTKECVVNTDDFYGRELAYKVNIPCVSYGINEPANSFAIDTEYLLDRTKFVANILDDIINVDVPFVGVYNVYNLLAGLTVAKMLGLGKEELQSAISCMHQIDGRFNLYNVSGRQIVIDFAHTPSSIDNLLYHISNHTAKKIISVFGCVGYSDRDKRYEMASVVAKYSDWVVVTSDNPCDSTFDSICADIVKGLKNTKYYCIEDRESAIKFAFSKMSDENILVLIGKGAENFQTIRGERIPFSDKKCVLDLMEQNDI